MVLDTACERPHGLVGLRGEIFDREDELDIRDVGVCRSGEDGAVQGAEGCECLLAIDVID